MGCGDVGLRLLPHLRAHFRVIAVSSQAPGGERHQQLREAGAIPMYADLDDSASLRRLAGLSSLVVYLAPPSAQGEVDWRARRLAAILPEKARLVYISTTGVYGDVQGAWIDETQTVNPHNARACRRVSAELTFRAWAKRRHGNLSILRVPGIYAHDRLPLARLQQGVPALHADEDVYSNHIHAEDLAYLIYLSLFRATPNRVYHAVDDTQLKMGDYFDLLADHFSLARVPRLSRAELSQDTSPAQVMRLSFMSESRRLKNERMKAELGMRLRYPTVALALQSMPQPT